MVYANSQRITMLMMSVISGHVKDTRDVIAQPLANMFNLSLQTGIFPDGWKIAKISPVFKEGNKTDAKIIDQFL